MWVTDYNVLAVRRRLYIPHSCRALGLSAGDSLTRLGSTGAMYGLKITATGTAYEYNYPIPKDVDPAHPLGVKVVWGAHGTTLQGTVTFTVLLNISGSAALPDASNSLNTSVGAQTLASGYANIIRYSARGIKNGNWTTRSNIYNDYYFCMSVNVSAVSGTIDASNAVWLFGLELDYTPMDTRVPHSELDAPLTDTAI